MSDAALLALMRAIAAGDARRAAAALAADPELARRALASGATRASPKPYFFDALAHYVYAGDTALHVAAAGHRLALAKALVRRGADLGARNRRGATPLHYATDGGPGSGLVAWDPAAQARTIAYLVGAGADPDATDKGGIGPLHRAVRCRCADAVAALLEAGADPHLATKAGSRPIDLAMHPTGRGGSGSPEARREGERILKLLRAAKGEAARIR
jgi:hypothetical protein